MSDPVNNLLAACESISHLVEDFRAHADHYLKSDYSEARVREDFINPFFIALGWDVRHEEQRNPYQQEVRVEKQIVTGSTQRRADYSFSIAPNFRDPVFLVEAKKPFTRLDTAEHYFQALNYAWTSGTPIVVLTDFEELHVLDARFRPTIETVLDRAILKAHYSEYSNPETFSKVYYLFAREEVRRGSIDSFVRGLPRPRGARGQLRLELLADKQLDELFLQDLDNHRLVLARSLGEKNPKLTGAQLTEISQRILDRLVFIRFLEDKQIEAQTYLDHLGDRESSWASFLKVSSELDRKYNGIVFKPHEWIDASSSLKIDHQVFSQLCHDFSRRGSDYHFDVIPIHILGSIYERFLGRVVSTDGTMVSLQEKPEVRKSKGVYYTPHYIVRYLVSESLGPLALGKSPEQLAKIRVIDLSCGSGSFLLGAFEFLMECHAAWYLSHPERALAKDVVVDGNSLRLTLRKKREILINSIFGIDIDPQAREVACLSLYLKLLEEESPASTSNYQHEVETTLLPSLSRNIVCGNSLVEPSQTSDDLFAKESDLYAQALSLKKQFPHQFDAVIGNPPYVHVDDGVTKKYLAQRYSTYEGKPDLYKFFIERGIGVLSERGRLGYIVPKSVLTTPSYTKLRKLLLEKAPPLEVGVFSGSVFPGVAVNSATLVLQKGGSFSKVRIVEDYADCPSATSVESAKAAARTVSLIDWKRTGKFDVVPTDIRATIEKMRRSSCALAESGFKYSLGMQVYHNTKHSEDEIKQRIYHSSRKVNSTYMPESTGANVSRYVFDSAQIREYVSYGDWCYNPPEKSFISGPRVIVREVLGSESLVCGFSETVHVPNKALIVIRGKAVAELKALLCVMNSRLLGAYLRCTTEKGDQALFPRISLKSLAEIPVPKLDEVAVGQLSNAATRLIAMYATDQSALTEAQKEQNARDISHIEDWIETYLCEKYSITSDEAMRLKRYAARF